MNVAFIGLGVMGYPMAGHLQNNGHNVTVFNRTHEKALKWQAEYHGNVALTPGEAVKNCDIVFCCVGNDNDVKEVLYGSAGVLAGLKPNAILVDHTTASAELAKLLFADCAKQGNHFIDAPVSGGEAGAVNGVLTVMCGGEETTFNKVAPVLNAYARFSQLMGEAGSGQLAKMVNQICIAGVVQGLAEGFQFAEKAGLNPEALVAAISKGAAGSWQMDNRYKTMFNNEYDFGFAVDWMRKDLSLVFEEAGKNGAELPMTTMVDGFYEEIQNAGGSRWDTSSLMSRYKDK